MISLCSALLQTYLPNIPARITIESSAITEYVTRPCIGVRFMLYGSVVTKISFIKWTTRFEGVSTGVDITPRTRPKDKIKSR